MTTRGPLLRALGERLGLSDFCYPVPRRANTLPYSLGGISAAALFILAVSGVLLGQFYDPLPQFANDSVRVMMDATLPRALRGIHYWTARAMVLLVLLHLLRVFWTASFKRPREANWTIGVALLATTIGLFFTGTVLKWVSRGVRSPGAQHRDRRAPRPPRRTVPSGLCQRGPDPGPLHRVREHSLRRPAPANAHALLADQEARHLRGARPVAGDRPAVHHPPVAPDVVWVILLGAILGLSLVGPALDASENWVGLRGLWGSLLFFILLLLVPIADRSPHVLPGQRRWTLAAGVLTLLLLIGLGLLAYLTPGARHFGSL